MKNMMIRICCLLLIFGIAVTWIPATAEEYTINNIRQYVAGVDEPVELADGSFQPQINFGADSGVFDHAGTSRGETGSADGADVRFDRTRLLPEIQLFHRSL